jgi:hypothetical protein
VGPSGKIELCKVSWYAKNKCDYWYFWGENQKVLNKIISKYIRFLLLRKEIIILGIIEKRIQK